VTEKKSLVGVVENGEMCFHVAQVYHPALSQLRQRIVEMAVKVNTEIL
jgi:hypothetical protein